MDLRVILSTPFRAVLAVGLLTAACSPVVTHGPRVDPGVRVTGTLGTIRPLCDSGCADEVLPAWSVGARYGFPSSDPSRPAAQVGISVPAFDPGSPEADLYVQGPGRTGPTAYGIGVLSSPRHLMPYAQIGHMPARGMGWYVTPAYTWSFTDEDLNVLDGDNGSSDYIRRPHYFSPAVALHLPGENASIDIYLAGAFGELVRRRMDYDSTGSFVRPERQRIRTLMLGATMTLNPDGN
jgi:hypothetical protein